MNKITLTAVCAIFTSCIINNAHAENKYWIGGSGNFDTASNWSSAGQPINGDAVIFRQSDSLNRTINYVNTPNLSIVGMEINSTGTGITTFQQAQDALTSGSVSIGQTGKGIFTQSGGTHTINLDLGIGGIASTGGTYNLSGGALSSSSQYIATKGKFNQSGGTNSNQFLTIGGGGGYTLTAGSLSTSFDAQIGGNSAGIFSQSGGTNTVSRFLYLGSYSSDGTYNLSGTGVLSAWSELFGGAGPGHFVVFNQSGGTNNFGSNLGIGGSAAAYGLPASTGTYNLSSGSLISTYTGGSLGVGYNGTFNQTGGYVITPALSIGNGGQYLLKNGSLTATYTTLSGGNFVQAGGSHTTSLYMEGGTYTLSNGQLTTINGQIGVYGNAIFNQTNGTHQVTNNLQIASGGTYNLTGGTFSAAALDNGGVLNYLGGNLIANITNNSNLLISGGGVRVLSGGLVNNGVTTVAQNTTATYAGAVSGGGSFVGGGVNIFQGTFAPGSDSVYYTYDPVKGITAVNYHMMGSVSISGNTIFESSNLMNVHLGNIFGPATSDQVNIFGDATLGGTLSLSLFDGYTPQIGDNFNILSATHLSGSFSDFIAPTYSDRVINLVYGDNFVRLETTAVPLPSAVWLLSSGFMGLIGFTCKRKAV